MACRSLSPPNSSTRQKFQTSLRFGTLSGSWRMLATISFRGPTCSKLSFISRTQKRNVGISQKRYPGVRLPRRCSLGACARPHRRLDIKYQMAYALKAIHAGMRSVLQEPIRERIQIGSYAELIDYVGLSLKHETVEVLRLLYLDRKNGLISDEEAQRGTVDHVPIYPRETVKRALEFGASAVIMVHNHPSGDPAPSQADVNFSQQVERALSVMNITLHDSLIVGKSGFASLRSLGRL